MSRKTLMALMLAAALAAAWFVIPVSPVASQEVSRVVVTNFPHPQDITGTIKVEDPIRLAELVAIKEIIVPPVSAEQTTRWVEAGTIETDGFPNVVLSLHGQVKGELARGGSVAAVLIPEQEGIMEAFFEQGMVHFSMNVVADPVSFPMPYFASAQPRYTVGFQAYRVFLYNETDKSVTVDLFAYLTN